MVQLQLHSQLHLEKRVDGAGGQSKQVEWIGAKLLHHMLDAMLREGRGVSRSSAAHLHPTAAKRTFFGGARLGTRREP